ncbi:MAG: hypothetical protein V2A73_03625, partial [Pseudomonadota bacterium]
DFERLAQQLDGKTKVVVVGASLQEDEVVRLLRRTTLDHLIASASGDSDDYELVVTSVKLLRGDDIFGLEKYLAWGVLVHERTVLDYHDKRNAIDDLAEFSRDVGTRRQMIIRIESVADELLMNAMYDAPAAHFGLPIQIGERCQSGLGPIGGEPVLLRFGCDGRHFALSVRDNYGKLGKEQILESLARARAERGNPKAVSAGGTRNSGLGLYFVLCSVTRFVANVDPGRATEVIALFDIRAAGRDIQSCTRSLHVFTTARAGRVV